jgi:hypothetical protein
MHHTRPDGTHISSNCDFCNVQWDPETGPIMIEGHQGSLMCVKCISAGFSALVYMSQGEDQRGELCKMCLEKRQQPAWLSPMIDDARACLRCIKQGATALEKDKDARWTRPARPDGAVAPSAATGRDDDDDDDDDDDE